VSERYVERILDRQAAVAGQGSGPRRRGRR
jgi:hypothetical protein